MVAPSAPRDARSKIPPGPEGSNGIDRCGCRGQPAGPSPFPCFAWKSQDLLRKSLGPGEVLPNPTASPRPLTKGALLQQAHAWIAGIYKGLSSFPGFAWKFQKISSQFICIGRCATEPAASPFPIAKGGSKHMLVLLASKCLISVESRLPRQALCSDAVSIPSRKDRSFSQCFEQRLFPSPLGRR